MQNSPREPQPSQQQFTVKVSHADDTKKFKLPSLLFSDLKSMTTDLAWSTPLPSQFNFYYMENDVPITIDNQESLREAIYYFVEELQSYIMRLVLARNRDEALQIMSSQDSRVAGVPYSLGEESKV